MTPASMTAWLLVLAAALACMRTLWQRRRARGETKAWRLSLLLLGQWGFAALVYFTLHPPTKMVAGNATLTVLVDGATARDAVDARGKGHVLALPEAPSLVGVERVPDLGTALRRHRDVRRVRVVGAGLPPRDNDAARDVAIEPVLTPLPRGLQRLQLPARVVAGAGFVVSGNIGGVDRARIEFVDPAGRRIDAMQAESDGAFAMRGVAFTSGAATFRLRVFDVEGALVEEAAVPLWISTAKDLRVLLLAGAPNPETRALRRWMQDAGFDVATRISLGAGVQLGAPLALDADALAKADLLVVDARAWSDLGDAGRARAMQAVDAGMGLLLRADAPLPASALRQLQAFGFEIGGGSATSVFRMPLPRLEDETALRAWIGAGTDDAPFDAASVDEAVPELARRTWRMSGTQAMALLLDAEANAVAWWRAQQLGRVGIWTPLDTWTLPLHGRGDLYADAWGSAFATLARPVAMHEARVEGAVVVGERLAICGTEGDVTVASPDGHRTRLVQDPKAAGCAAFWPAMSGWHHLSFGENVQPFHVRDADALPGVHAAQIREATLRLASWPRVENADGAGEAFTAVRTSSWPWFIAWLAFAAGLWWFERSRHGRVAAGDARP